MEKRINEPIRIAHVVGKWVGGGVEAVIMNYYRHIDKTKIQFDFLCDSDSINIPYDEIESLGGKVILIPPYQKIFKYQKEVKKVLKEGNYKIVHSHINTLSVFPLRAAKKAGVPVRIAHSHSTTNKKEWKKNLFKLFLKNFIKTCSTEYFACSEHAARWMFGNKTFDSNKVYLMNNGIDLENFKYDKNERSLKREELKISENTIVIGHIGRFVAQKNHKHIIEIFNEYQKNNDNSVLLLIGQGPLMDNVKLQSKELGIENKVIFLGQRNDVNELYQAMDLFLFPSLYEGLGMVVIEAECSNLPCLCSTEVPKIVKINENLNFLNLTDSPSIWRKEMEDLLSDKSRCDRTNEISEHGYNIRNESKKLEKEYIELINKKK